MIHRYLHEILTVGFQFVRDNPSVLDELFQENYVLESDESDSIKTYFLAHGCNVVNGYPRDNTKFPAIAITLGAEMETQHFLGDSGGIVDDDTSPDFGKEILASIWDHSYNMLVITEHPDVTAYYYEIAKFVILDSLDILTNDGQFEFQISGKELAPDGNHIPEELFIRELIFRCEREFQRISRNIIKVARSVSGIHLDDGAQPSEVGYVKTNVTTFQPNDDDTE